MFVSESGLLWVNCRTSSVKSEGGLDFSSDFNDDILISHDDYHPRSSSTERKFGADQGEEKFWLPETDKFKCSKCKKHFRWKIDLVHHLKVSCGGTKCECCPFCDYRTDRKWNLKSHMKRRHNIQH